MDTKSYFSTATKILRGTPSITSESIKRQSEKNSHLSSFERQESRSRTISAIKDNQTRLEAIAKKMGSFKSRLGDAIDRNDNYGAVTTAKKIVKEIMDNTALAISECHTIDELREAVSCAGASFEDLVSTVCK